MISKEIEIDGKLVPFKASAAIPRLYRARFRRDIFRDLMRLGKAVEGEEVPISDLELFENVAYIMALHADPKQPGPRRSGWTSSTRSPFTRCFPNSLTFGI